MCSRVGESPLMRVDTRHTRRNPASGRRPSQLYRTPCQALNTKAVRLTHRTHAAHVHSTLKVSTLTTRIRSRAPRARHALSTRPEVHIPLRARTLSARLY